MLGYFSRDDKSFAQIVSFGWHEPMCVKEVAWEKGNENGRGALLKTPTPFISVSNARSTPDMAMLWAKNI